MVIFEKSHLFFQFQPFLEIEFSQVLSIQLHDRMGLSHIYRK